MVKFKVGMTVRSDARGIGEVNYTAGNSFTVLFADGCTNVYSLTTTYLTPVLKRTDFKVDDRVWSQSCGWGTVKTVDDVAPYKTKSATGNDKPIFVDFDGPHHGNYTVDGKAFTKGNRVLFFTEQETSADALYVIEDMPADDKSCFYSDGGDHYRGELVKAYPEFDKPFLADNGTMYQYMDDNS